MMRRRRTGGDNAILLPDTWAGRHIRREETACRRGTMLSGRSENDWLRVTLIGHDPMAIDGMRHLLARLPSIWLHTLTCVPDELAPADQDLVIWVRMRHDGMPDLAGYVTRLCRHYPDLKQLVISDLLPTHTSPGPGPLSGVWLARGTESRDMLSALLLEITRVPRSSGPLLSPRRLSRMQWRILLLRSAGVSIRCIADICGISVKTVSTHESSIRERLGVSGRAEYAWLLRSVAQMQIAVPALCRDVKRLNKVALNTGMEVM